MRKVKVWINGKFKDPSEAKVSATDPGLLYGFGLFETMRAYDERIFKPGEHLSRLFNSAKIMGMKIAYSKKALEKALNDSMKHNKLKDAYIRITVTKGGNVIIITKEFSGRPSGDYVNGISIKVSKIMLNEHSPLSGKKTLNYLNYLLAKEDAGAGGYGEAILLNTEGDVAEGATSNIFLVKNGKLLTPPLDSGILPGITRKTVMDIARKLKIALSERRISPEELTCADEIFLTNSLAEILPAVKIDRTKIGRGRPGEITKLLHAAYRKMV